MSYAASPRYSVRTRWRWRFRAEPGIWRLRLLSSRDDSTYSHPIVHIRTDDRILTSIISALPHRFQEAPYFLRIAAPEFGTAHALSLVCYESPPLILTRSS